MRCNEFISVDHRREGRRGGYDAFGDVPRARDNAEHCANLVGCHDVSRFVRLHLVEDANRSDAVLARNHIAAQVPTARGKNDLVKSGALVGTRDHFFPLT
jgi:hypothetical protein